MKKFLFSIALAAAALSAGASLPLSDFNVERSETALIVSLQVDPSKVESQANREEWYTPVITDGSQSVALPPIVFAGRTRYIQHLRHDPSPRPFLLFHAGKDGSYLYSQTIPYQDWMGKSAMTVLHRVEGCCGKELAPESSSRLLAINLQPDCPPVETFEPIFVYVKPVADSVKAHEVHGSAFIDFKVNRTDIEPDYRRNPQQLAAIRATIDSIRFDRDVTITDLSIKGFASPEGPYDNNLRLAKGRTEALVDYVRNLYSFPADIMHTSWEAEDWAGLIDYVKSSNLDDREAILEVVSDTSLQPDTREWRLKSRYPKQYAFLLREVYPALRHSDYAVNFIVRNYVTIDEIAAVMASAPQKLSLEEIFRYAQTLDRESPQFQEAMEVAVRMYPSSEVANLNAAVTALGHAEYDMARAYLAKAGSSSEALYARGILEAKTGNYQEAVTLFNAAAPLPEARDAIKRLRDLDLID